MKKVEVTLDYLKFIYEATKELRVHGCTCSDLDILDKMRDNTKYYLNKTDKGGNC